MEKLKDSASEYGGSEIELRKSTSDLAEKIVKVCPIDIELPRGYTVVNIKSNVGSADFLQTEDYEYIDGIGKYLHGDYHAWIGEPSLESVETFVNDVKTGLLDEIREFLLKQSDHMKQSTVDIQDAADKAGF